MARREDSLKSVSLRSCLTEAVGYVIGYLVLGFCFWQVPSFIERYGAPPLAGTVLHILIVLELGFFATIEIRSALLPLYQASTQRRHRHGWHWGHGNTWTHYRTTASDRAHEILDSVITEYRPVREVTGDALAALVQRGDLHPLLEAYAPQRLRELEVGAKPRPRTVPELLFGTRADAFGRSRDVIRDLTDLTATATDLLIAAEPFRAARIKASTASQQYELEHAKLIAAIAEQKQRTADYDAAARRVSQQAPLDRAQPAQLDDEQQRRHAAELADEEHQMKLSESRLNRALNESRIEGLKDPDTARRRKAERKAARAARGAEHLSRVYDELARKAARDLKRLKKEHGEDSEAYQHAKNAWDSALDQLAKGEVL